MKVIAQFKSWAANRVTVAQPRAATTVLLKDSELSMIALRQKNRLPPVAGSLCGGYNIAHNARPRALGNNIFAVVE